MKTLIAKGARGASTSIRRSAAPSAGAIAELRTTDDFKGVVKATVKRRVPSFFGALYRHHSAAEKLDVFAIPVPACISKIRHETRR